MPTDFVCCSSTPGDILLKGVQGMSLSDNGVLSNSSSPPLGMRGHYIDTKQGHRRMSAVGSNQNKAITKRLASAGRYQQVTFYCTMHCTSAGQYVYSWHSNDMQMRDTNLLPAMWLARCYLKGVDPRAGHCHCLRSMHEGTCQLQLMWLHVGTQVLEEVGEWVKVFDEVNVATALHRLAKLQPPGSAGPQSPVLRSAAFQLLVEACQRLVPRFEAQAVSNTLWGERTVFCVA